MDEVSGAPLAGADIGRALTPSQAMRLAIRAGRRGRGFVSPNPLVGCAILDRRGKLLAYGHHARYGEAHAEINAIRMVGDKEQLKGAHFYVTLEPCAHEGKTGSCARAIAPLRPASVTYAVEDPFPLVAGRGAEILRQAGIRVALLADRDDISDRMTLTEEAEDLAEIFLHNQRAQEPFVAVKIASTLDGQMGLKTGESKWITGERAREHVHLIRARYDAVAIGANTFFADDPALNVRHSRYPGFVNRAIVFDPHGKALGRMAKSKLFGARAADQVIVIIGHETRIADSAGVKVLRAKHDGSTFDITDVLAVLRAAGVHSLMVEGGAHAIGSFIKARKVQRLHAYLAPSLLGGLSGAGWSSGFGVPSLSERIRLEWSKRRLLGEDLYWTARVRF